MATIYVYPKQGEPFTVVLEAEDSSLGRSQDNTIPLPDPFCSGRHAAIFKSETGYAVRDIGSKNGTFVNGSKIAGPTELKAGDEILVGSCRIVFDKPIQTSVEVTEMVTPGTAVNAAIPFRDILNKPAPRTTILATVRVDEAPKIKAEKDMYAVLSEVSQALVLHKPLAELLEHVMDLISAHLKMDRGVLMLKEGSPIQFNPRVIRVNAKTLQGQKIQVSKSIMNMAVEQQLAVLTSDAAVDPRFQQQESIINSGIHSAMCVPLWNNKEIIGIIYADRITLLQEFSQDDLRLMTLLSNLAAVKIENAILIEKSIEQERMERELQLAAQIQKDFLPKSNPTVEHYDIAGKNIPCLQVGGDYYDFLSIDPARLGITVADVSGKGVSASLLMASLRAALHSEVHPHFQPAAMAVKLNDFVQRSSNINSFITFFFCELDKKTGELIYVNAGHNPPLWLKADGSCAELESTGLCLGMLPGMTFEEKKIKLGGGDLLVLFTDGITESRNPAGEEYGSEKLAAVCRKNIGLPVPEILKAALQDLEAFTAKAPPHDDRTLVLIRKIA